MGQLMAWFSARSVSKVLLQSTPDAEHLYRQLGFEETGEPTYRWRASA